MNLENIEIFEKYQTIIGVDESGKGDYFGPLVVSGVLVNKKDVKRLAEIGAKDSKTITDNQIKLRANIIKNEFTFNTVIINPSKYNELYDKFKNLNKLLSWAHARVIENILNIKKADLAISDKFGDLSRIKNALMEEAKKIDFLFETKAEKYIPVATASILARCEFLNQMDKLSSIAGFKLKRGGGSNTIIDGKKLIDKKFDLKDFAKLHFKNTKEIYFIN